MPKQEIMVAMMLFCYIILSAKNLVIDRIAITIITNIAIKVWHIKFIHISSQHSYDSSLELELHECTPQYRSGAHGRQSQTLVQHADKWVVGG
jgi:hypothetical protein